MDRRGFARTSNIEQLQNARSAKSSEISSAKENDWLARAPLLRWSAVDLFQVGGVCRLALCPCRGGRSILSEFEALAMELVLLNGGQIAAIGQCGAPAAVAGLPHLPRHSGCCGLERVPRRFLSPMLSRWSTIRAGVDFDPRCCCRTNEGDFGRAHSSLEPREIRFRSPIED